LLILSRLRKLEPTVTKILEDMPITFEIDIEKDYLYKRGVKKGIEKGKEKLREEKEKLKEEMVKKEEEIHKKSIIGFFEVGNDIKTIAKVLKISQKRVKQVIEEWNQKGS